MEVHLPPPPTQMPPTIGFALILRSSSCFLITAPPWDTRTHAAPTSKGSGGGTRPLPSPTACPPKAQDPAPAFCHRNTEVVPPVLCKNSQTKGAGSGPQVCPLPGPSREGPGLGDRRPPLRGRLVWGTREAEAGPSRPRTRSGRAPLRTWSRGDHEFAVSQ